MRSVFFVILFFGLIKATAADLPVEGLSDFSFVFEKNQRTVKIFRGVHDRIKKWSVLVLLHGGNGSVEKFRKGTGQQFENLAKQKGFLLVYAQGTDSTGRNRNHWNDGRDTYYGNNSVSHVDDVGFLKELAKKLKAHFVKINSQKIYLAGVSNGAMMTMRVACQGGDPFAGYAAIIGSLSKDIASRCQKTVGKPMLFINGTEDRLVSYDGKDRRPLLLKRKLDGERLTVPQTLQVFTSRNSCKPSPQQRQLPNKSTDDDSRVERWDYDCRLAPVRFYKVVGGGHSVPGMEVPRGLIRKWVGKPNQDINSAETLWTFFKL